MIWPRCVGVPGVLVAVAGDVAGELSAVGALGFELGFGALGAGALGVGEGALCLELGGVAVAEGVAFAGGVVADALCFLAGVGFGLAGAGGLGVRGGAGVAGCGERVVALALEAGGVVAGGGDLLARCFLACRDLRGGVAAELVHFGGEPAGGFLRVTGSRLVVAGGCERLGECLCFGFGFCLAGPGGDGGGLGAAAGGFRVGDVGADAGGVEGGGLVAGGPGEDRGLAEGLVERGERVAVPAAAAGGGGGEAGIVVVAAGAFVAAENPVAAGTGTGRDEAAAAGSLAFPRAGPGVVVVVMARFLFCSFSDQR